MENQPNRTLAYLLANPIQETDLETISGGHSTLSTQQTMRMTGNSAQGPEMSLDFSIDA